MSGFFYAQKIDVSPDGGDLVHCCRVFYGFPTAIYEESLAPNEHKGKGNLMVTIKYFMNGKLVDIEVTEEFAKQYERIVAEEKRLSWKNVKRSESSLEVLLDAGFQAVDPTENVEEHFFSEFERQRVIDALKQLEPAQGWLIEKVFFYDRIEDKKLLLFDNFKCWDDGEYIGEVSPNTISKLRKSN